MGSKSNFDGKEDKDLSPRYRYQKEHGQTPAEYRKKTRERVRNWDRIPLLVTVTEMAALIRVDEPTLRKWRKMGLDEHGHPKMGPMWTRLSPNKTVYRKEDIEQYFLRCQNGEVTMVNEVRDKMTGNLMPDKYKYKKTPKTEIKRETVPPHLVFRK